jgi:hypothetical protein
LLKALYEDPLCELMLQDEGVDVNLQKAVVWIWAFSLTSLVAALLALSCGWWGERRFLMMAFFGVVFVCAACIRQTFVAGIAKTLSERRRWLERHCPKEAMTARAVHLRAKMESELPAATVAGRTRRL